VSSSAGVLRVARRLDREFAGSHVITIRCFRPYEANVKSKPKKYDSQVRNRQYCSGTSIS
jgi:hypothetical protein